MHTPAPLANLAADAALPARVWLSAFPAPASPRGSVAARLLALRAFRVVVVAAAGPVFLVAKATVSVVAASRLVGDASPAAVVVAVSAVGNTAVSYTHLTLPTKA